MSRHRGLPAGSRVFGQPPAGPPVCQRNRLVRRHRPGAGRAHERRMAATGRDSAASRSNPPLAGTTVFSHDPPGVSVRTWSVAVRVRVSRGYAGGSPDGHLDHFRVTVRNGVDTRGRQGLMRVRSTLSQVTTCGRSRRHGLLALSLVLGILFVNSLHAQRAGDLRGLSDALESLTERVQPAVVHRFSRPATPRARAWCPRVERCSRGSRRAGPVSSLTQWLHRHKRPRHRQCFAHPSRAAAVGR